MPNIKHGGIRTKELNNTPRTDTPLISVITVVYNGEKYLEQTIQSVLNQSYTNKEYIIIDGVSTDNTLSIIKKYQNKINYWVSETDNGIYDAINKGIFLSKGILIGIVNSDDWLEEGALESISEHFITYPEIDVFHGICRFFRNENEYMMRGSSHYAFSDGMIEHPTFFIKREVYDTYGLYSLDYRSASDLDFIYRIYTNNAKFLLMPKVISNFRAGGISDSFLGFNESLTIRRKYNFLNRRRYLLEKIKFFLRKNAF